MTKKLFMLMLAGFCSIATISAKDIRTITFRVEQMHCSNCEKKVKNNLRFEKGVKSIKTEVPQHLVVITYDAEKTTVEKLQAAFEKFDYTAVELQPNSSEQEQGE